MCGFFGEGTSLCINGAYEEEFDDAEVRHFNDAARRLYTLFFDPQLKELNRGLSAQGKLFRSMERYLQRNEGVFYFVRPVYNDLTWIPHQIDFGIFTKEKGLLLNRFDNRRQVIA